jgi:hypothetical protein
MQRPTISTSSKCDKFISPAQDYYTERVSITSKWHVLSESSYLHVTIYWWLSPPNEQRTCIVLERSWVQILARLSAVLTEDLVAVTNSSEQIPREHVNVSQPTFPLHPWEVIIRYGPVFRRNITQPLTASLNRPKSILFHSWLGLFGNLLANWGALSAHVIGLQISIYEH